MLKQHHLYNCLPGVKTLKEGVAVYKEFFSDSDVKKYGVLAIKIKVI